MKCYYEVLNVGNNCESDEIKKGYRKLALIWHPDKNLDNTEEAKLQFQLIQEAYDVLIDPHERAWYDRNREIILAKSSGEASKDNIYDVYPYFRTSCYKGFEDDEKGFYNVYRKVFNMIAAKELDLEDVPTFGNSQSSFENVQKFYSYWNCFCTKEQFYWLDAYDVRQATNRKIFKYMEKGKKKIRDEAKKERNELIRNLVRYVSKRDKRLLAYSEILKEKAKENTIKAEKHRKKMREKHKEMVASCKESEWSKFSNFEKELNDIESSTMKEFNENENDYNEQDDDELYCIACNKYFKNVKSFENHENSKKHKESILILKQHMEEEERINIRENNDENEDLEDEEEIESDNSVEENIEDVEENNIENDIIENTTEDTESDNSIEGSKKKKENSTENEILENTTEEIESENSTEENTKYIQESKKKSKKNKTKENLTTSDDSSFDFGISKKQKKKMQRMKIEIENIALNQKSDENNPKNTENEFDIQINEEENITKNENVEENKEIIKESEIKTKKKKDKNKNKSNNNTTQVSIDTSHTCVKCKEIFTSKNKLFTHLKESGHSVYLPSIYSSSSKSINLCKKTSKNKKLP